MWAVNRPEWGIAFLAIAHAGGVAVPLDVRHTVDFGRKIVAQTGARLVVASRQTEASARQPACPSCGSRPSPIGPGGRRRCRRRR